MQNALTKYSIFLFVALFVLACGPVADKISENDFRALMTDVAEGWSDQDTERALSSFDADAIYMEPPNIQYYRGHTQLRPYFDALDDRYKMQFHHLWFDEERQSGAGEYTFSYGKDTSDVGVVVIQLKNGKIKFWREYQRKGPTDFDAFLRVENKAWDWHIGNYPPKDTIGEE